MDTHQATIPGVMAGTHRLQERYRDAAPQTAAWSPVVDSLLQHRSVRAYTSDPLPPGTLETMVAAAQSASTSSNLQTWSVVAVEDQARRDHLAAFAGGQRHISQAPLFLCWLADLSRATRLAETAGRSVPSVEYLETFLTAVIDASLAAQNAVAAAESLGLGTVYIGGMRNHPEKVAAELALPPGAMVVFGLCVGVPDTSMPAMVKPRLPQPVVLHREQYDAVAEATNVSRYDDTLRSFQVEQAMTEQGWTDLLLGRLAGPQSMSGRDRLAAAIHTLGFMLR